MSYSFFFFFNDTATTEIYTLSLHDALPIYSRNASSLSSSLATHNNSERAPLDPIPWYKVYLVLEPQGERKNGAEHWSGRGRGRREHPDDPLLRARSEEHTSELQSLAYLVCRLLLEKKKNMMIRN